MTRVFTSDIRDEIHSYPDPFPVGVLKRVDRPTTLINDHEVSRVDERDGGFQRAGRAEYGRKLQKEYRRFMEKYPLSGALLDMSRTLSPVVDGIVNDSKAPLPEDPKDIARHIKETAYFLRADMVGICELPQYAVFSHSRWDGNPIELDHKYAIGILIDQDWKTAAAFTGSDWISNSMSFLSYSTSGFIACILADYIRRMGYPARAHHAMNYQVVLPPILLWAGLGEMCRMGDCVLNPFLGPRFKAAVVTTDLPLAIDKPIDFGLQDFCEKCGKCARECPSQAISYGGKEMYNGYERWPVDVKSCTSMRVGNNHGSGCGTCIKVCPWNKPYTPFHRFVNWMLRNYPSSRKMAINADDWFGYGKPDPDRKWWLDMEEVDGELRAVPPQKDKAG
ncbi:MAG: reductive dehalogenase [bacterium]|nr:reductive dehalogenase [bacterium]